MTGLAALQSLLAVQKRRVEQALREVRARNELVRRHELQRNTAVEQLELAIRACQVAIELSVRQVVEHLGREMDPTKLEADARGQQWRRLQVEQCRAALSTAEAELAGAREAASEAHVLYRRARAREDALLTLIAQSRQAEAQHEVSLEEEAVEELIANRRELSNELH